MTLFPDQLAAQEAYHAAVAAGFRSPILVGATAFGKTHWAADLIAQMVAQGARVWFLAHLEELLLDTAERLEARGVRFGWIWADQRQDLHARCQVVSVATARARLSDLGPPPDLAIIDECHRTTESYRRVLAALGHPPTLGLTGTPIRLDGRSMRSCGYDHMIRTLDTVDLIGLGRLSPLGVWSFPPPSGLDRLRESQRDQAIAGEIMSGRVILGDALEAWAERCRDRPTAVFCSGVRAARETAEAWRRAGFRAMAVDGTSSRDDRRMALELMRGGGLDALMSADMYIAGLNLPDLGAVICLRHTDSLTIWLQMVGRGLRKSTIWADCILHDHAGNARRPGLGHPLARRMHLWDLDDGSDRRHREAIPGVRVCESCYSTAMVGNTCLDCGHVRVIKTPREAVLLPGDLVRMEERGAEDEYEKWENVITEWVGKRGYKPFTTEEILSETGLRKMESITHVDKMRLRKVLNKLEFTSKKYIKHKLHWYCKGFNEKQVELIVQYLEARKSEIVIIKEIVNELNENAGYDFIASRSELLLNTMQILKWTKIQVNSVMIKRQVAAKYCWVFNPDGLSGQELRLRISQPLRNEEARCQTLQDWVALGTARNYINPLGWARVRYGVRQKRQRASTARRVG